jgi:hypothetical protein
LRATSRDTHLNFKDTRGTADDPTVAGGRLRVSTTSGDAFDLDVILTPTAWRTLGKPDAPRGYRYVTDGPIRSITVKTGGALRIVGSGADLALSLGADPNPVVVELMIGKRRYCMRFGGDTQFRAGRRFVARRAPAPAQCN